METAYPDFVNVILAGTDLFATNLVKKYFKLLLNFSFLLQPHAMTLTIALIHLKVSASLATFVSAQLDLLALAAAKWQTVLSSETAFTTESASITTSVNVTSAGRESTALNSRANPLGTAAIAARALATMFASATKDGADRAALFLRAQIAATVRATASARHRTLATATLVSLDKIARYPITVLS